jgi:hypothetical protein
MRKFTGCLKRSVFSINSATDAVCGYPVSTPLSPGFTGNIYHATVLQLYFGRALPLRPDASADDLLL